MKTETKWPRRAMAALAAIAVIVPPCFACAASDPFTFVDLDRTPTACNPSRESQHIEPLGDYLYFVTEPSCDGGMGLWRVREDGSHARLLRGSSEERACGQILGVHAGSVWVEVGQRGPVSEGSDCNFDELWVADSATGRVERVTGPNGPFWRLSFVGDRAIVFTATGVWSTDGSASGTFRIDVAPGTGPLASLSDALFLYDGVSLRRATGRSADAPAVGRCDDLRVLSAFGDGYVLSCRDDLWVVRAGQPFATLLLDRPEGTVFAAAAAGPGVAYVAARYGGRAVLWASDGTPAGTRLVFDANDASIFDLTVIDRGAVFVVYRNGARELWGSDGTTEGTVYLDGAPGNGWARLEGMGDVAVAPFAADPWTGRTWVTDGTPGGTYVLGGGFTPRLRVGHEIVLEGRYHLTYVLDRDTRALSGTGVWTPNLFPLAGIPYATGYDLGLPVLWRLDGGEAIPVSGLGFGWGTGAGAPTVTDRAYFWVSNEIWVSDGSTLGTHRVLSFDAPTWSSDPGGEVWPLGDRGVFATTPQVAEPVEMVLWVTDGTPAGTEPVVVAWADGHRPLRSFAVGEKGVYFVENLGVGMVTVDGRHLREERLYREPRGWGPPVGVEVGGGLVTGGCDRDTVPNACGVFHVDFEANELTFLAPGAEWGSLDVLGVRLGDRAIVAAENALVATDGTPEGTEVLASAPDFHCSDLAFDGFIVAAAGRAFISCRDWPSPTGWWSTQGTPETTRPMEPFPVAPDSWYTTDAGAFFVHDGSFLYTDGTLAGTRPVLAADDIGRAAAIGGTLYFLRGADLWKSDGTPQGTVSLGLPPWHGRWLVASGDLLAAGTEIWDSTTPDTPPKILLPIPGENSLPSFLGVVGRSLLFSAVSGDIGRELLIADIGTAVDPTVVYGDCSPPVEQDAPRARVRVRTRPDTGGALWSITAAVQLSAAEAQTFAPEAGGLRIVVSMDGGLALRRFLTAGSGQWRTRETGGAWSYRSDSERVAIHARELPDGEIRLTVRARVQASGGIPDIAGGSVSVELSPIVDGRLGWCAALPATCTDADGVVICR